MAQCYFLVFLLGCSPSPLLPSVASAAAADLGGFESVGAASAPSGRRRTGRGKGGKGTGGTGGGGGGSGGGSGGGWGGGGRGGGGGGVGSNSGRGGGGGRGSGGGGGGGSGGGSGGAGHGSTQRSGSGGGQRQQQQRSRETLSPQQLREWYAGHQRDLSRAGVAIFDLDYDAILAAMYAVSTSDEGDCYLCLLPDPGSGVAALGACEAAALGTSASAAPGAGESALSGTASAQAFHTFTLDSGASRSFFRDRTTLTPLSRPVAVSLADPSGGPILASFSTVLPCPAAPSGTLSGLYLPSFSTNLVSGADLQDQGVDQFTPASQRVTHCKCARTGRHLATFTRQPGSSLYTLSTESPPVPASGQVAASSQVFAAASGSGPESAACSCRLLSHQTLLWHHRLGHPSLPCLRGMASRVLVSGLPRSLPPLPPGPAPTCVPCVEGRQRAAPHSSEFPPTEAPLQTLHMDVWGPARVRGQGHERYFLLVVDDYSRYTTVFPLRSKGDVTEVLIDWIRAARLQLRESFGSDFPVLRLHSDRGGEFSSARLGAFCHAQGIRQTFTLPTSPQQNGIAECRIGIVMDVARTSMIHAAAPHFLWPFAVGDASAFWVWGSRAFVRDLSADKLSPRAVPCVFLGFPPDAPGWQFYHPTSRRVLSSQDITFDESVPFYRLFPYRTAPLPPPPLFLAPNPPHVDPLPPQGPAPSGVSQVDGVEVAVDSGTARGAEPVGAGSGGAESGGAEPRGAESGGAEPGGTERGGAASGGAELGGAEPGGAESARVASRSASSRRELLSPQELREWFARRWSRAAGAGGRPVAPGPGGTRTGGTGAVGTGGAAAAAGVGPAGASGATSAEGAGGVGAGVGAAGAAGAVGAGATGGVGAGVCPAGGTAGAAGGTGAAGPAGVGAVGAGGATGTGATTGGTGAVPVGSGGPARPRPYFVPLLEQVLGLPPSPGPAPPLECPQPVQSQSPLQPVSPLPAPSPYAGPTGGLAESRERASRPASLVRTTHTSRRAPHARPPAVPGTHQITLCPSTAPLRVPLPSPPESSLPVLADPVSDSLRAASPTVARLLSTVVTHPSFESTAALALVAELVDFAARCRLDYAASLVAESASVCPPSVGGECALSTDVLEDRQEEFQCFFAALPHLVSTLIAPEGDPDAPDIPTPRSYAEAIKGPYSSQWQSAMDAEMASWKSTGTYVDEVPPPGANIWHNTLRTTLAALGFAPSAADPSLFLRTDTSLPPFYILVYVDDLVFATADTAGLAHVKFKLQKRHTCTDLGELRSYLGLQITRDRAQRTITLTQSHMVQQVLQRFDFTYSSPQATPLSTRHSLSALPSDESVEPSGPYPELVVLGGRRPVVLTGHADASWADDQATQRSSQGYTFSLGSGSVSWRSTRSSSVLGSSCEAEIYAGAMAAQELRWLTYLLTDLGEPPRSPPVLYVDKKAMLALCREHRLEHRTKHIALRYFLARELQQRGQLRLAYVASEADTADVFTKALPPGDHQRFSTMLDCVVFLLTQSLPRFTAPTTLLADIIKHNIASTAPVNNVYIREGNKTANTPGAQNSGSLPGATARRAKRPAEEAREDLATGVEVLFGATSSAPSEELLAARAASKQPRDMAKKTAADAAVIIASAGQAGPSGARDMEHAPAAPSAPSAPSAPADASPLALTTAQVQALLAMLQQQAPVTVGTSNNDEVTASAKNNKKEENAVAPRPPKAARVEKNPAPAPTEEDSDESEDAALQQGDAEGALANVTQIETLINKCFEVLLVADEAGFEAADRFQLYQSKSVLTSCSYKLAVADVAASKRARMSYNRTGRGNGLDNGEIGNKGAGQGSCQNRAFKGTCFRCGQPGHMANACPMGGRGGQGPTPVV
ncbi:unnamed protein product [Closterium sp. NIES-54]